MLAASLSGFVGHGLALAAVFGFYVGWTLSVNFLQAYGSGWTRAAKAFRAESRPRRGPTFASYRSPFLHRIGRLRSNLATFTGQGIYLEAAFSLWRPFHPPLMLPWSYFRHLRRLDNSSLVELAFEDPVGRRLRVPLPATALPALRRWSRRDDFSIRALR